MPLRQIVIDTDPGLDDAVAMLLALASPDELEVLGIVAVAGNLPLDQTERNARRICELAGRRDLPVYAGCARPLLRPLFSAERLHGETEQDRLALPEPAMPLAAGHGVDFLIEAVRGAAPGAVTWCALGPLTNLAMALAKAPEIAARLGGIVLMGGGVFTLGNVTPAAEFNIHVDPHAAAIVFASGAPIAMLPLDLTYQALSTRPRLDALAALGNRCGTAVARLIGLYDARRSARFPQGGPLHDPCVVAYLLRPDLFAGRRVNVMVETDSPLTLGMTVADWWGVTDRAPNAQVLNTLDADGFYALLTERLRRLP